MPCSDLMSVAARSQNTAIVVAYDESTFFLRRCRSCDATVNTEALFGAGISGSGAGAEPFDDDTKPDISRKRAVRLFKSAHMIARPEAKEPPVPSGVLSPFLSLLKERGRRRPSSPPQGEIILPYSTRKLPFRKASRRDFRIFTESSSTGINLWYNRFCISMDTIDGTQEWT